MKLTANRNLTDYQTKLSSNNSPAFKARFVSTPAAKVQLKKGFIDLNKNTIKSWLHFGDKPFNFGKFYENLKNSLESVTSHIRGTIKLVKGEEGNPYLQFITPKGEVYEKAGIYNRYNEVPAFFLIEKGEPVTKTVIAQLSDLERNNSKDSEDFANLYKKISNKE